MRSPDILSSSRLPAFAVDPFCASVPHSRRLPRYIVCARITKHPIFEFLASAIHPDSQLTVFAFSDDYSFGVLQSGIHWAWFIARCSTLKDDFRYTSDTVFDTFPWPQFDSVAQASPPESSGGVPAPSAPHTAIPKGLNNPAQGCEARATLGNQAGRTTKPEGLVSHPGSQPPTLRADTLVHSGSRTLHSTLEKIHAVAEAAVSLRALRREIMAPNGWSLRDLYRTLENPGTNRLRDEHAALDSAVRAAYGAKESEDTLAFLLRLNLELAEKETTGQHITPPGLAAFAPTGHDFVSPDCIQPPG
jgi:hypothetical protein